VPLPTGWLSFDLHLCPDFSSPLNREGASANKRQYRCSLQRLGAPPFSLHHSTRSEAAHAAPRRLERLDEPLCLGARGCGRPASCSVEALVAVTLKRCRLYRWSADVSNRAKAAED